MPHVPTMAEAGISDYEQTFRLALFAPAGTPAPIVARLNREIGAGLTTGAVIDAFTAQGVEAEHSTPRGSRRDFGPRKVASKARIVRH
jgi:tripartite-type tricarboxylate transporter receptor subunit TctC